MAYNRPETLHTHQNPDTLLYLSINHSICQALREANHAIVFCMSMTVLQTPFAMVLRVRSML